MTHPLTRFVPLNVRAASRGLRRRFAAAIGAGQESQAHLFDRFESLGDGCELAALQRAHGIERPALFNWRGASIEMLLQALQTGLDGFDRLENLSVDFEVSSVENAREYMIVNSALGSRAHTFFLENECSAQQVLAHEHRSLILLKRKFLSDVASARRVYVYHASLPVTQESAQNLASELERYGENTLLWVAPEDGAHPAAEVEKLGRRLYKGYIALTHVDDYGDLEKGASWIPMLQNALALMDHPMNKSGEAVA